MPLIVTAAGYGPAAESALAEALQRAKQTSAGADPLAPVTIVAPSFQAGLHIRHMLGRRERGIVNVQVKPLAALLELIGAGSLAAQQRRPLPEAYRTEVIRAVAESGPNQFGDLPIEGSVLRTLEQTFRQFDECDAAQLDNIGGDGGIAGYLVDRYREYLSETRDFYTRRDLAESATAALDGAAGAAAALQDIGNVVVYLPGEWTAAQMAFIHALAREQDTQVIVGLTGDAETVDQHALSRWGLDSAADASHLPTAQRVVQSPDPEEEVRSAIRDVAASLLSDAPTPLHRTAILYRQPEPYARICAEQLDAAGMRWNGPNAATLGQSIAGRVLGGLLNLVETPAPNWATDVAPWLAAGPIRDVKGDLAPTSRWNHLARSANLQRDHRTWPYRLEQYRTTCEDDLNRLRTAGDEDKPGRFPWLQEELAQIDALAAFIAELVAFVDRLPRDARWSEFAAAIRGHFHRLLGERMGFAQSGIGGDNDLELARWDDVETLLNEFNALDELSVATRVRFAAAVRRGLDRPTGHHGRIGDGLYVGPLHSAIGMTWDKVYIVGAAERSLPQIRREDPMLSDQLRERASLPVSSDHMRRERSEFLAALHAAGQRVISYPRADVRAQQARLPSRWLLESATALNDGQRMYASRIGEAAPRVVRSTPSFERAIVSAATPGDVQEYDLRSMRSARDVRSHFLATEDRSLGRGFAQRIARQSRSFTRWDGLIDAGAVEAADRPHSAGALQDWATCPHRYFLGRVLRVEERAELRDDLQIAPVDKGSIVHDILDRFFKSRRRQPDPGAYWSESDRAELMEIAEDELDEAHRRGVTGRALLWERDRRRMLADLETLLEEDERHRARQHVRQVGSEVGFGPRMDDSRGMVALTLENGDTLQLRGKIDRVDRSDDGQLLIVIDYKSGREFPTQRQLDADPVIRGRVLQLPIYAEALRQLDDPGDDVAVQSGYWFITERGGFKFNGVAWNDDNDRAFRGTVNLIMRNIRDGLFPQRPGAEDRTRQNNCRFCSFNEICPADRRSRWDRIKEDVRLSDYVALSEDAEEEEDET